MYSQKTIDAPKKYAPMLWLLRVYVYTLTAFLLVAILSQGINLLTGVPVQFTWERLATDIGVALVFPVAMPVGTSFISPLGAVSLLGILVVGVARETKKPNKLFLSKGFGFPEWLLAAGVLGTVGFAVFWLTRVGDYTAVYLAACGYWIVNLLFVWWMTRRQHNRLAQA